MISIHSKALFGSHSFKGKSKSLQTQSRRRFATFSDSSASKPKSEVSPQNTTNTTNGDDLQMLPLIEKARSLLESRKSGTFTSVSLAPSDKSSPLFGSLMPYVMMPQYPGQPVIALRVDEKHYAHIQSGERASLVIFPLVPKNRSPKELPLPKLNMTAACKAIVEPQDVANIVDKYEMVHPGSGKFLKDQDLFQFYYMEPQDVFYMMSTQEIDQFRGNDFIKAKVDPIAKYSRELLEDINANYSSELKMLCHEYGDVEVDDAIIFGCDRLGFDILGKTTAKEGMWQEFRMPLEKEIVDIEEYREIVERACKDVRKVAYKNQLKREQ